MVSRIAMFEGTDQPARVVPAPVGASLGNPIFISQEFKYQSYFDSTAEEMALLLQAPSELIIGSTARDDNTSGYGVGLHPSSETPISVLIKGSGRYGSSQPILLTPGQVVFPRGRRADSLFTSLRWGLPFGWLGGGLATLVIFQHPESDFSWPAGHPEILFHRQRVQILASDTDFEDFITEGLVPLNWPTRFPWLGATRAGASANISQAGQPVIAVDPTRTILRLRTGALAASKMRCLFYGTNHLDFSSVGAVVTTAVGYQDVSWPLIAQVGTTTQAQYPLLEYQSGPLVRLGCEAAANAGLVLIDTGSGADLTGIEVDICRYGRIG